VSTLEVIVNGVMWSERPNLLDTGPADRVYITREDAAAKTSLTFADGISGVRPATGKDNIHARYRKGLGLAGNADVDAIAQLVDSVPGIQSVSNPEPAIGGADRESEAQIRTNAPAKLRTFNRAVAIDDFPGLALSFPGVAMASAAWQREAEIPGPGGGVTRRTLSQPVIRLTIGTTNGKRLDVQGDYASRLRRYLDSRRDVNVPLVLVDYDPIYIDVAATIDVDDVYGRQATLRAAIAALNDRANADGSPAFFAEFGFGQSVHLSAVYAALQAVPGVRAATVTELRQAKHMDTIMVLSTIPIGPSARAVIGNQAGQGSLVLTLGVGGFAD
jgi:predicted phage baseplate assembly protein